MVIKRSLLQEIGKEEQLVQTFIDHPPKNFNILKKKTVSAQFDFMADSRSIVFNSILLANTTFHFL